MAVYTEVSTAKAQSILEAHGIAGPLVRLEPVPAGSVNSNYIVHAGEQSYFLRVYEEQDYDGAKAEWGVLELLQRHAVPTARRISARDDIAPSSFSVDGKPVALFERVGGVELAQSQVTEAHMRVLGATLARVHLIEAQVGELPSGRFKRSDIVDRLDQIERAEREELAPVLVRLRKTLGDLPRDTGPNNNLVHGDLFRDNVRWVSGNIGAILDWESASAGAPEYDLAVVALAWGYADSFSAKLLTALREGYASVRTLREQEQQRLFSAAQLAAVRFTTTRITDWHLRQSPFNRVMKDYRRFLERLDTLNTLGAKGFLELFG